MCQIVCTLLSCNSVMANVTDDVSVPVVDIDDNGTFKYVLIKISNAGTANKKNATYLVRGHCWADYHMDLVEECERQVRDKKSDLRIQCVGGGRIRHDRDRKNITVYGYSVGYGQADHALTCKILKTYNQDYTIDWHNEGY